MDDATRRELADDGTVTVTVTGEIDYCNADDVSQAIRDAVADWSPSVVRVDLSDATFIDSTGLGALIEGYRAVTEAQGTFLVVDPTAGFRRVLSLTGLGDLFGIPEDAGTAAVESRDLVI
jgi:anti-sigma B factor antagonist